MTWGRTLVYEISRVPIARVSGLLSSPRRAIPLRPAGILFSSTVRKSCSPTHIPTMADEPSLPPLPAVSWDAETQSFSNNPRKRGRAPHRMSTAPANNYNSSDPAVFSSDDDPALDNYVEGRKKKRYVGSWFQQQPASSDPVEMSKPEGKRKLTREFDSGVFLCSDDSIEDMDVPAAFQIPARPKLSQLEVAPSRTSEAERQLQSKIRESLDNGTEIIDCWNLDLQEISNETLQPLSQFEYIPQVIKGVAFEQKDPELKLLLAQNRLNRLPGTLFDVTQLTTLSLRNNALTEIPPAIRQLRNLQELNLSQNRLRNLPAEILELLNADAKLQKLIIHPNPFLQPDQGDEIFEILDDGEGTFHTEHDLDMELEEEETWMPLEVAEGTQPRLLTRRLARSPLQVTDSFGRTKPGAFTLPSTGGTIEVEEIYKKRMISQPEAQHWTESRSSGSRGESMVPSLIETVLRSCQKSVHLSQFKSLLSDDFAGIRQLLDRAVEQKAIGGLTCSRCRRTIVVPTLSWIEWREINTMTPFRKIPGRYLLESLSEVDDELVVPFLHRACSWRCGPGKEHSGWEFPKGCQGMTEGYVYQGMVA